MAKLTNNGFYIIIPDTGLNINVHSMSRLERHDSSSTLSIFYSKTHVQHLRYSDYPEYTDFATMVTEIKALMELAAGNGSTTSILTTENPTGIVVLKGSYVDPQDGDVIIQADANGASTYKYTVGVWTLKSELAASLITNEFGVHTKLSTGVHLKRVDLNSPEAADINIPNLNMTRAGYDANNIVFGDPRGTTELAGSNIGSFEDSTVPMLIDVENVNLSESLVAKEVEIIFNMQENGMRLTAIDFAILEDHKFMIEVYDNSTGRKMYQTYNPSDFEAGLMGIEYVSNVGNPVTTYTQNDIYYPSNSEVKVKYIADKPVTFKGKDLGSGFIPYHVFSGIEYITSNIETTKLYNPTKITPAGESVVHNNEIFVCVEDSAGTDLVPEPFNRFKFISLIEIHSESVNGQLFDRKGTVEFDTQVIRTFSTADVAEGVLLGDITVPAATTSSVSPAYYLQDSTCVTEDVTGVDTMTGNSFSFVLTPTSTFILRFANYYATNAHESTFSITRDSDAQILHKAIRTYTSAESLIGTRFSILPDILLESTETYTIALTTDVYGGVIGNESTGKFNSKLEGFDFTIYKPAYYESWSEKIWTEGEWLSEGGMIYVCQVTGVQHTDFQTNLTAGSWKTLSDSITSQSVDLGAHAATELSDITSAGSGSIITTDERDKLTSLTGGRYLGVFADLAALVLAHPTAIVGDTATVSLPAGNLFYWDSVLVDWVDSGTGYYGDMLKSVYDPATKGLNIYSMDNMDETLTKLVFTKLERDKLTDISPSADVNNISDLDAGALTSSGDTTIHYHAADRDRNNHTGTQLANTIFDFDTAVSANSSVAGNSVDVTLGGIAFDTTDNTLDLTGQELTVNLATTTTDGAMAGSDKLKLDNIASNGVGDHWCSGLAVTENNPKDQTVLYGNGQYLINGILKSIVTGGTYDLTSHYVGLTSKQHRFVTLYVDADLAVKSIQGVAADDKVVPDLPLTPSDSVAIALVEIKVDSGALPKDIDKKHITDQRNTTFFNTDEFVKVSSDDLGSGHLSDKLSNNGNVQFTIENVGGIETIKADASASGSSNYKLAVQAYQLTDVTGIIVDTTVVWDDNEIDPDSAYNAVTGILTIPQAWIDNYTYMTITMSVCAGWIGADTKMTQLRMYYNNGADSLYMRDGHSKMKSGEGVLDLLRLTTAKLSLSDYTAGDYFYGKWENGAPYANMCGGHDNFIQVELIK